MVSIMAVENVIRTAVIVVVVRPASFMNSLYCTALISASRVSTRATLIDTRTSQETTIVIELVG